jgi:hypothetical protein
MLKNGVSQLPYGDQDQRYSPSHFLVTYRRFRVSWARLISRSKYSVQQQIARDLPRKLRGVECLVKPTERVAEKGYIDMDVDGSADRYKGLPLIAGKVQPWLESGESSVFTCHLRRRGDVW